MMHRGKTVPGGACGFWGACGAGISAGMFISIISGSTPLAVEPWGLANRMTSRALEAIGAVGGPRCCKRDSYLSILAAVEYVKEHFGVEMETSMSSAIIMKKTTSASETDVHSERLVIVIYEKSSIYLCP